MMKKKREDLRSALNSQGSSRKLARHLAASVRLREFWLHSRHWVHPAPCFRSQANQFQQNLHGNAMEVTKQCQLLVMC